MSKKKISLIALVIVIALLWWLSIRPVPEKVTYGVSFSVLHSDELKLDWKKVYNALLNDLNIKKIRLSAHWPMVEPKNDTYNWSELDYQIQEAEKHDAEVVFSVGRRLPGWPECHEPEWAYDLSREEKQAQILEYITKTVNRYKDSTAIKYWQVENEPFLNHYAMHHCKGFLDEEFLKKEIALVKSIDSSRSIIVTDSGEVSLWYKAYTSGDIFGTTMYLYIWNHYVGPIRYPIAPAFFKIKRSLVEMFFGEKESILIELAAEPWLLKPIVDTDIDTQLKQMNLERFNKTLEFARKSGFEIQYLWGAEWWYYMKENNHPEFWERAKEIYSNQNN